MDSSKFQAANISLPSYIFVTCEMYIFSLQHKSDLDSLIQVMIIIFGEHPPVYAKPKTEPVLPHNLMNSTPYPKQRKKRSKI